MDPIQIKLARTAVGWGVRDLAKKSDVAANTISRIENGADAMASTLSKIKTTLENAGVVFIDADENGGPGVRLKINSDRW